MNREDSVMATIAVVMVTTFIAVAIWWVAYGLLMAVHAFGVIALVVAAGLTGSVIATYRWFRAS